MKVEKSSFEEIIRKLLVVIVLVLLVVSVWGLYASLNHLIDVWIGYRYAPIYKSLLNLAVLILAIYVLNILLRRK